MTTPLTGQSFWLDRKVRLWTRSQLGTLITLRGGSVADAIAPGLTYVVLDPVRKATSGTSEPEQQATSAGARVIYLDDLHTLLCPGRDEALDLLRGGPANAERWAAILPLATSSAEIDLAGADLSGLNLAGFTFRRCNLAGANLAGVNFDGATFVGLHDAVFRKAGSMRGLTISSARGCDFDDLDLAGVKLDGRFDKCTFRRTILREAEAASVEFLDCVATEADWSQANFAGCVATKLNALTLRCQGTQLNHANFTEARLDGADFTDAALEEAVFEGAHLEHSCFGRANLHGANFSGGTVEGTDFRGANLADADFTSTKVTGADFGNANIRGAKLVRPGAVGKKKTTTTPTQTSAQATPSVPQLVPQLAQLRDALNQAPNWVLSFALVTEAHGLQRWTFETQGKGRFRTTCDTRGEAVQNTTTDWVQVLVDLHATNRTALPQVDTVRVLPRALGESLELLPAQAICSLFGIAVPQEAPLPVSLLTALTGGVESFLRKSEESLQRWNATPSLERKVLADCRNVNLSGLKLAHLEFGELDASGVNFEKTDLSGAQLSKTILRHAHLREARLKDANLVSADCRGADAEKADLTNARLTSSDWRGANLQSANLKTADLKQARFQAADLSDANLSDVKVENTQYDEGTRFPEGFKPGRGWVSTSASADEAPADFNALVTTLTGLFGFARWRDLTSLFNAGLVPLWSEGNPDGMRGVVPEAAKSTAFRACHLTSSGGHQCGTQNFALCDEGRTGVCKHLMVLLLDLARRERIPLGNAVAWARLSLAHDGALDRTALAAIFAAYAESTQSDYRPNETLPEDYYAL
jgi:uncharacterized protein YjbI with pentapeptide repeats